VHLEFNFLDLVVLSLATFRLSTLAANDWEVGPRGLLARLRKLAGVKHALKGGEAYGEPGSFADGLLCNYCNSIWFAVINTAAYVLLLAAGWPAWIFFLPLALSGFVVLVFEIRK
jgi:hypothetical protein